MGRQCAGPRGFGAPEGADGLGGSRGCWGGEAATRVGIGTRSWKREDVPYPLNHLNNSKHRTLGAASRRSSVILSRIIRLSAQCWHLRLSVLGSLLAQPIFPQGPLLLLGVMPFQLCRAGPLARKCRVSPSQETLVSQLQCPPQRCPPALLPVTGQREKYNMGVGGAPQTIWSFPIYCRRVSGARWPEWVKTLSKGHIAR